MEENDDGDENWRGKRMGERTEDEKKRSEKRVRRKEREEI